MGSMLRRGRELGWWEGLDRVTAEREGFMRDGMGSDEDEVRGHRRFKTVWFLNSLSRKQGGRGLHTVSQHAKSARTGVQRKHITAQPEHAHEYYTEIYLRDIPR